MDLARRSRKPRPQRETGRWRKAAAWAVLGAVIASAAWAGWAWRGKEVAGMPFSSVSVRRYHSKEELAEPFLTKNILRQSDTVSNDTGIGYVSDPSSLGMLRVGGLSGGGWFMPFVADFMGKGRLSAYDADPPTVFSELLFGGDGVHYVSAMQADSLSEIDAQTKWKLTSGGLPMPMVDYQYARGAWGVHFEGVAFSHDGIQYVPCSAMGLDQIRLSIKVEAADLTATHFSQGNAHTVVITKTSWPCKIVVGCSQASHWYAGVYKDVGGVVFDDQTSPYTGAAIGAGFEWSGEGITNLQTCFAFSLQPATLSDADASAAVIGGLSDWKSEYEDALAYWEDFWAGYGGRWDNIDPEIRAKGLIAVQQIAAMSYNGAMIAGSPTWVNPGVWLRDACWSLRALPAVVPDFAEDCLEWFVGKTAISGTNSYTLDGVRKNLAEGLNNTDNAAVFLIAAASVWAKTGDAALFASLLPQIQSALAYAKTNYVAEDKHITALHPHDYWDESETYGGEMDTDLVKYESVIDVLWAAALRDIAPCLATLGEAADAAWCTATSDALIAGLEDYRDAQDLAGGLHYAIKTDDTLYDTVIALPGNIYAAHFLNDSGARGFLADRSNAALLAMKNFKPHYCITFSNYLDTEHTKKDKTWGPHIPLVAGELAKLGNYDLLPAIKDSMPFGSWGEGVCASAVRGRVKYYELALDFPWSLGEVAQLCETLRAIQ